jgi:hypothetical protein
MHNVRADPTRPTFCHTAIVDVDSRDKLLRGEVVNGQVVQVLHEVVTHALRNDQLAARALSPSQAAPRPSPLRDPPRGIVGGLGAIGRFGLKI